MRQIIKEIKDLTASPPEGIKMIPNEEDLSDFQATIDGPG
jgi:ubiquitin-conjugating enzyme E2 S